MPVYSRLSFKLHFDTLACPRIYLAYRATHTGFNLKKKPLPWCAGRGSNPLHGVLEAPLIPYEFQRDIVIIHFILTKSTIWLSKRKPAEAGI